MELAEILYQKTNDQLKQLARLAQECRSLNRKDDLVNCLRRILLNPDSLGRLWRQLDDLSKKAVASAYYNEGEFYESAFIAHYGALPGRPEGTFFWHQQPILLDLFIYNNILPGDLMPLLEKFVPPPDKFQVQGLAEAPEEIVWLDEKIKLSRAETEQAGLHDLAAYLRLIAQGELNASSTGAITLAGFKKLKENLLAGDFLPLPDDYRANQTIRPFGLDVFGRGAGLATYNGRSGLRLTERGEQFYQTQAPELLLEAFESWTQAGAFDELSRITGLKGLKSKQTRLTRPASRREAVIEALSWCPVEVWIDVQDFYRAMKIWHFDFEVETTQFSNLYVGHREYGTLYGESYWRVVKGLYINVVLWEYLGTIGALDLLYTEPEYADDIAYTDYLDEDFYISLYDGLRYFRINSLGAYLLGQVGDYTPSKPLNPPLFSISPDRQVTIIERGQLTPNDEHLLACMALPLDNRHYQLDTQQVLTALEAGHEWRDLNDFLVSRHKGPLPEGVVVWLDSLRQNSQAFKSSGQALLIKVSEARFMELVMADPVLQKFCSQIDRLTFVVPATREKVFRNRLKELEYVLM